MSKDQQPPRNINKYQKTLTVINKYKQIYTNINKYQQIYTNINKGNMKKHKERSTKLRNMKNDQEISTNINKHKRGTGGQSARCLPNALKPFRYYVNTM